MCFGALNRNECQKPKKSANYQGGNERDCQYDDLFFEVEMVI